MLELGLGLEEGLEEGEALIELLGLGDEEGLEDAEEEGDALIEELGDGDELGLDDGEEEAELEGDGELEGDELIDEEGEPPASESTSISTTATFVFAPPATDLYILTSRACIAAQVQPPTGAVRVVYEPYAPLAETVGVPRSVPNPSV